MPELPDDRFSTLRDTEPERPELPAAEVRRRGDRRRRRRNLTSVTGSALAVVLVVGWATAMTRTDSRTAPDPAPAPTITSSPAPTTIPADVPLDAGLPELNLDGTPVEVTDSPGVDPLTLCGKTLFDARAPLDVAGVFYEGAEDYRGRTLLLLGSQAEASVILRDARDAAKTCPSSDDGIGTLLVEPVSSTLGEESVALLTQYENDGPLTGPTVHHLVRIGSSVLITSQSGEVSNTREGLAAYTSLAATAAEEVLDAITAPAGQSPGADVSSTVTAEVTAEIPDAFPLDVDQVAMEGDGGEKTGPAPDALGVGELETCGVPLWDAEPVARLASNATGPEYDDARELRVYADADIAVAQMDAIRAAVEGCLEEQSGSTTLVRTIHAEVTGYSTFTFSTGFVEGLGGTITQFVRVGNAVLGTVLYGEFGPRINQASLTQRTDISETIAPSLCIFTVAGC